MADDGGQVAVGINGTSYTVTVHDANGQLLGTTTESITEGAGTASAFIDLRSFANPKVAAGTCQADAISGATNAIDCVANPSTIATTAHSRTTVN